MGIQLATIAAAHCAASAAGPPDPSGALIDAMRERIFAYLALRPGMAVAEIGAGPGWFVLRVAEAIGSKGVVYATDIDPGAVTALKEKLARLRPGGGRVELRLCRDGRDTALDDLPAGHLDLILMVDSLCFDDREPRERNVSYLHRFLRILRPGGRLVHHMDCRCDVSPDAVVAQFTDAGFSPRVEVLDVSPAAAPVDTSWPCRTEVERRRHAFVAVFRKPDIASDTEEPRSGMP